MKVKLVVEISKMSYIILDTPDRLSNIYKFRVLWRRIIWIIETYIVGLKYKLAKKRQGKHKSNNNIAIYSQPQT